MRVESCWRTIKSGLRTRPVFHWKPHRISAHVSLCVLALLIERIAEIRTGQSWRNVRAVLDTVKVVEYERGSALVRQTTELRSDVEALLQTLKIAAPPRFHSVAAAPAA
jgi:transposase